MIDDFLGHDALVENHAPVGNFLWHRWFDVRGTLGLFGVRHYGR